MFRFPEPLEGRIPRVVSDETQIAQHSKNETRNNSNSVSTGLEPSSRARHSQLAQRITEPGPNDVLCGRGSAANNHSGNRKFRDFVKRFEDAYQNSCKADKSFIALQIVLHIQTQSSPPGRFLMKLPAAKAGSDKDVWYEIDAIKASKKVSQRLREKQVVSAVKAHKESKSRHARECENTTRIDSLKGFEDVVQPNGSIPIEFNPSPALVVEEEEDRKLYTGDMIQTNGTSNGFGSYESVYCHSEFQGFHNVWSNDEACRAIHPEYVMLEPKVTAHGVQAADANHGHSLLSRIETDLPPAADFADVFADM